MTWELGADERALYIVLEALCAMGYVEKENDSYIIADRARPLFIDGGKDYVGGYLPHTLNKLNAWLKLPKIIKGEKTGRRKPDNISTFMNAMASTQRQYSTWWRTWQILKGLCEQGIKSSPFRHT
ncbi:MAG: hypothetical protein J5U19_13745 [Candidatus Methanoperedens sp.]|nr:hypothetical protein [Candidatus Methanoperedens sp.]